MVNIRRKMAGPDIGVWRIVTMREELLPPRYAETREEDN
jgi:hypothetical protein